MESTKLLTGLSLALLSTVGCRTVETTKPNVLFIFSDDQIGRILEALKKSGKADNTYIIFTSDHGLAVGHHGLLGKQNMYEHSMRVPLIIDGPGIKKDAKINARVYLQDIMPTTLELAGSKIPEWVEFKSLLPLIKGEKKQSYGRIYGKYKDLQRMIIKGDYKLIIYPQVPKYLLFDLKKDPDEMNDLANDPKYADTLKSLKKDFKALQKEMGDSLDVDKPATGKKQNK